MASLKFSSEPSDFIVKRIGDSVRPTPAGPLKPAIEPGHPDEQEFLDNRPSDMPAFSQAAHDKLFRTGMDGKGQTYWIKPTHLTARQILATHVLVDEHSGEDRAVIFHRKMNDLVNKRGLTSRAELRENEVSKVGVGSGAGVEDGITNNGYDWSKPLPLTTAGMSYKGEVASYDPTVVNGQHRLMYMFAHHPNEPIPFESSLMRSPFTPSEQQAHDEGAEAVERLYARKDNDAALKKARGN